MMHAKTMVVDGIWTTIGSSNFDDRSFRLNDEVNVNIYDETIAAADGADVLRRSGPEPGDHPPQLEEAGVGGPGEGEGGGVVQGAAVAPPGNPERSEGST